MNLSIVTDHRLTDTYGGGQVYVRSLIDGLIASNHAVTVVSALFETVHGPRFLKKHRGPLTMIELSLPTAWKRCGGLPLTLNAEILKTFRSIIQAASPDLVHANGWKATVARVCSLLEIPCVITVHHGGIVCPAGALLNAEDQICDVPVSQENCLSCCLSELPGSKVGYRVLRSMPLTVRMAFGRILKRLHHIPYLTTALSASLNIEYRIQEMDAIRNGASSIVAPSRAIEHALIRNRLPRKKIHRIPHGIAPFRRRGFYGDLHSRPIRFFYIGRINRVKGLQVLFQALRHLSKSISWELHIIGDAATPSERRFHRRLMAQFKPDSRVVWHGQVPHGHLPGIIAEHDVLILPTICLEVFGLTVLEAFSIGRPVIATRCGGPEELVRDEVDGFLVERNDCESLAAAMRRCMEDPERIVSLADHIAEPRALYQHIGDLEIMYRKLTGGQFHVKHQDGLRTRVFSPP